ncbi:unnamed protein product, partial [Mesorhabditis belari]|uniref:Kringle domain-containing protein n=1 Tax=Mesorhabditis belari TaxID=2138241 RepID=A0AAF3FMD7_9BILA
MYFYRLVVIFLLLCSLSKCIRLRKIEKTAKCTEDIRYFSQNNLFAAECITLSAVKRGYRYFGYKNTTVDGRACVPWNRVWHYFALNEITDYPRIHERQTHSYCRQAAEYDAHPDVFTFSFDGSLMPYCYAYKKDQTTLEPVLCFNLCNKACVKGDPPVVQKIVQVVDPPEPNYNEEILDNLAHYFKAYNWGSDEAIHLYYDELQSTIKHSEAFHKGRTGAFLGALVFMLIISFYFLVVCTLKRRARNSREKKDAEKANTGKTATQNAITKATSTTSQKK